MKETASLEQKIRDSRFPPSRLLVYLGVLLAMSGIHTGRVAGMNTLGWNDLLQTIVPILYWSAVAVMLTLFTRRQVQRVYEEPMHKLAGATEKVAGGDFSVYENARSTAEKEKRIAARRLAPRKIEIPMPIRPKK